MSNLKEALTDKEAHRLALILKGHLKIEHVSLDAQNQMTQLVAKQLVDFIESSLKIMSASPTHRNALRIEIITALTIESDSTGRLPC